MPEGAAQAAGALHAQARADRRRWPPAPGRRSSPSPARSRSRSTTPTTAQLLGMLPFPEGIPHVLQFSRNGSVLLGGRRPRRAFRLRRAVRREDRQADRQGRRRTRRRAGGRHQRHAHAGRPRRPQQASSASTPTETGELLHEIQQAHRLDLRRASSAPTACCWPPADRSGGLFVWEADTAREYLNLRGHNGAVSDVSWRLDSQRAGQRQRRQARSSCGK